jgi:alpha-D-xyloside xylohydrolase
MKKKTSIIFFIAITTLIQITLPFTLTADSPLIIKSNDTKLKVTPISENIISFSLIKDGNFYPNDNIMILPQKNYSSAVINKTSNVTTLKLNDLLINIQNNPELNISISDKTTNILTIPQITLTQKKLTQNFNSNEIPKVTNGYSAKLFLNFQPNEAIYGLGQHEEGYLNYRGKKQYLYQHNLKVAAPIFISSKGYAVLFNTFSYSIFDDTNDKPYFWTDAVKQFNFYIIYGPEFDKIIAGIRKLTGHPTLFPKWTLGYIQSKERYKTQEELLAVTKKYRELQIPLDCIVQDWKYWPKGWGYKNFDKNRFPDMKTTINELHKLNTKIMISIWPLIKGCPDREELNQANCMLTANNYNPFSEKARNLYWEQTKNGLYKYGIDAWWCDCTEPVNADWSTKEYLTPEERAKMNTAVLSSLIGNQYLNAFSIFHSKGIFINQKKTSPDTRVVNLTRSAYPGQQRYGTITWSGDTRATWQILKKEIAEGLSFTVTGNPKWTLDAGAFFVKDNPKFYFRNCNGFGGGCNNNGYRELYTRWLQLACFLPMMRSHGTSTPREIWNFGKPGEQFYEAIKKIIKFRYRLLTYTYSNTYRETFQNYTNIRMLAFDFRNDPTALNVKDQYMFGPSLLIAPVTEPFYYTPDNKMIKNKKPKRTVYLPKNTNWYNFYSGKKIKGGQTIKTNAPIDQIPIFVKAGSILPLDPVRQYTEEVNNHPIELRIYPGKNASFMIYEDDGITTNYKKGNYSIINLTWNDAKQQLTISDRKGKYNLNKKLTFNISLVKEINQIDLLDHLPNYKQVNYTGKKLSIDIK